VRIRQIKPAFWSDPHISTLSEAARLFYIGMWMQADDAGWLRFDVAEVAHDLYGYENRRRRERRVAAMYAELVTAGRIVQHPCGHSEIPTLVDHQRLSGQTKQVRTVFNEHLKHCVSAPSRDLPQIPAGPRTSPPGIGTVMEQERELVRDGTERNGNSGASATTTEFRQRVPVDVALGGKAS